MTGQGFPTAEGRKAVVIGAGIGGLCAAIRLALAGLRVTLVEAQDHPGGKMRALPTAAGPVDAGPTVLTLRSVFDALFAAAGERLEDRMTLVPQPILARHWWPDGSRLDLFADPEASAAAISALAGPRAEAEFIRFDRMTARLYRAFEGPMIHSGRPRLPAILANALRNPAIWPALLPRATLARHLATRFSDPRLRQLFGRYATYVGGMPDLSPAVLALIWQAEARGVWAVRGGMRGLALSLAALADRLGVAQHYGVAAAEIACRHGRAVGVILADGQNLPADAVVFNGDPGALRAGLLGGAAIPATRQDQTHPRSLSAWVWSFAARPAGADLIHHNVFFTADPAREFGPLSQGQMPQEATLYLCAQDRGLDHAPPATERFQIIMNAPPDPHSPSLQEVARCRDRTFPHLARFGLTFDPAPPDAALMTPQGFARLFPGSQGAIYGRSPHGALASFRRPRARTDLPGLYLAGGGAHPGAGVPMAALSGQHAAEAILTDLTSGSRSARTAMPGGMWTGSPRTGRGR